MLEEDSIAKESAFCRSLICPMAANISLPILLRSSATPSAKGFKGSDVLMAAATALAAEAKSMGLIGRVVPDGTALERAHEIAAAVAVNGPLAVEAILRTLRETPGMTEAEAFAFEEPLSRAVFASDDAKEGPRAFAEKRTPYYRRG